MFVQPCTTCSPFGVSFYLCLCAGFPLGLHADIKITVYGLQAGQDTIDPNTILLSVKNRKLRFARVPQNLVQSAVAAACNSKRHYCHSQLISRICMTLLSFQLGFIHLPGYMVPGQCMIVSKEHTAVCEQHRVVDMGTVKSGVDESQV